MIPWLLEGKVLTVIDHCPGRLHSTQYTTKNETGRGHSDLSIEFRCPYQFKWKNARQPIIASICLDWPGQ